MRRDPRDPAAQLTVTSILDAAEQILETHGAITTNRIAERAGISIGTLYQYFPNKEAIAAGLFERYLAIQQRVFLGALVPPVTYGELPGRIMSALIESYRTQPKIHGHLFDLMSASESQPKIRAAMDQIVTTLAALLRIANIPADRAEHIAFALVHACNGLAIAVYQRVVADPTEIAKPFVDMVHAYLVELGINGVQLGASNSSTR